jgi:DNA-binding phage protein
VNPIQQAEQALLVCKGAFAQLRRCQAPGCKQDQDEFIDCAEKGVEAALTSLRSLNKEVEGVELPGPAHYQYLFSNYVGDLIWRNSAESWNGQKPKGHRALYTADQLRTAVAAALGRGAVPVPRGLLAETANAIGLEPSAEHTRLRAKLLELLSAAPSPEATQPEPCKSCNGEGGHEKALSSTNYTWVKCPDCEGTCKATQPTQAEVVSDREALSVIAAFPITDEKNMDAVNMRDVARRAVVRAALATQQAGQGEAVASESALASLIDLICPGLDSGDILADAQEAMRALNERTSQPESKARAVQRFHRDTFNAAAWVTQLTKAVEARGVTWAQVSEETGVSTTTLSRVRSGERQPDAASLAALSAWAGLNPANYCATPPAPGQVERDREDGK